MFMRSLLRINPLYIQFEIPTVWLSAFQAALCSKVDSAVGEVDGGVESAQQTKKD